MSLYDDLLDAAALGTQRSIIRIHTTYQPAGGPDARVYPPTYPTSNQSPLPYVIEKHLRVGVSVDAVLLDSVPSQANRAEEALLKAWRSSRVQVPMIEIHYEGGTLSSYELPHRYADAYLRDSVIDGVGFDKTDLGRSMLASTLTNATALYEHDPGSLVYGAWNSHRKGRQAKFPRIYSSEILGWEPELGARRAGRLDPLNLQGAVEGTGDAWSFKTTQDKAAARKEKAERLSVIGHGNIAPSDAHGGVTVTGVSRMSTVSLAALDRIGFGTASREAQVAARAALAAFALLADRLAFGRGALWLRSGCELIVQDDVLEWVGRGDTRTPLHLDVDGALELFAQARDAAAAAGLTMDLTPVHATPNKALADAIEFTLTRADAPE